MFIDKVKIKIKSGAGGNGAVSWRKEKYVPEFELKEKKKAAKPEELKVEITTGKLPEKEETKEETKEATKEETEEERKARTESEQIAIEEEKMKDLETLEDEEEKLK